MIRCGAIEYCVSIENQVILYKSQDGLKHKKLTLWLVIAIMSNNFLTVVIKSAFRIAGQQATYLQIMILWMYAVCANLDANKNE